MLKLRTRCLECVFRFRGNLPCIYGSRIMCIRKKYCWSALFGFFAVLFIPVMSVFAPPLGCKYLPVQIPPVLLIPSYEETYVALQNPWGVGPVHVGNIDEETLWLARAMFSESKRHDEQELIGWTVRNRVEAGHRGCAAYRECILDPFQFSAFLPGQPKQSYYTGLSETSDVAGWQRTLALAYYVRHADGRLRPFSSSVLHFYSEQSMLVPGLAPDWVGDLIPIVPARRIQLDEERFRFYSGVR